MTIRQYLLLASVGCSYMMLGGCFNTTVQDGPPRTYRNISKIPDANPHYLAKSKYGNPKSYIVNGETYHVLPSAIGYNQRGIASWYGSKFTGKLTSTRERYDPYAMTAASPILPIPCFARVTNLENGHSVIVKINDRGPFAPNRIIDLSYAAATKLGYTRKGTALVDVAAIDIQHPGVTAITRLRQPQLYLQAGAFSHYQNANRFQQRIAYLTDSNTLIKTTTESRRVIYRVQIGPLKGVGESDRLQAFLKKAGIAKAVTIIR